MLDVRTRLGDTDRPRLRMGHSWRRPEGSRERLYGFTVEADGALRMMYVGLIEELWMVTKGWLPNGSARPGQRYGRPRYAGVTRQRINGLIVGQLLLGRLVRHWVRPLHNFPPDREGIRDQLFHAEQELITRWDLRQVGWNRG